jgi:hypothetical protein
LRVALYYVPKFRPNWRQLAIAASRKWTCQNDGDEPFL